MRIRDLWRSYAIHETEIKQAQDAGFVEISTRKPPIGRPSQIVRKVNKTPSAKLPPLRKNIASDISHRHWTFALNYCMGEMGSGFFNFKRRAYVAYMQTYRNCKNEASARASSSRLIRKPNVHAAIQWTFARISGEISKDEPYPRSYLDVWKRLHELSSFRAKWAPWWVKLD